MFAFIGRMRAGHMLVFRLLRGDFGFCTDGAKFGMKQGRLLNATFRLHGADIKVWDRKKWHFKPIVEYKRPAGAFPLSDF